MMETRENDLAHSLLTEIRVFAELCIFFVLLGLILACSAGVFFGGVNVLAQESTMLKLRREEEMGRFLRVTISILPNLPLS